MNMDKEAIESHPLYNELGESYFAPSCKTAKLSRQLLSATMNLFGSGAPLSFPPRFIVSN
jgi:hypothetical protein